MKKTAVVFGLGIVTVLVLSFVIPVQAEGTGEQLHILKMLEEGKISAQEAHQLLSVPESQTEKSDKQTETKEQTKEPPSWFKVEITSQTGDKANITLPWLLFKLGIPLLPEKAEQALKTKEINLKEAIRQVEELGRRGELATIESAEGDTVRVWIE